MSSRAHLACLSLSLFLAIFGRQNAWFDCGSDPAFNFAANAPFDAVANAAGEVFPSPLQDADDEQWSRSIASKGMGQITVVRAGLPYIARPQILHACLRRPRRRDHQRMTMGTTVNRVVEGFVQGAATSSCTTTRRQPR